MIILVIGVCGIGGFIGSYLVNNNYDVTFIARKKRLNFLKTNGLKLESKLGKLNCPKIKVCEEIPEQEYFDIIIKNVRLEKEIKNLIIYKKGLFNSDFETENNLIEILKPITSSDSIWKSHALYLIAEYFFQKNQKQKAKEFYNLILNNEKSNENIIKEAQKRLSRDYSE